VNVTKSSASDTLQRRHFAWLSIAAAVATISLKTAAWWITGSVGLLSDALESFVNLAGAAFALWMIVVTERPADEDHQLGHTKAEYFSSGFEGVLIFGAAGAIIWTAVARLLAPQPLESLGIGLVFSAISTAINFGVAVALKRAATRFRSFALEADARHLMTDVVTSIGVVVAVAAVALTGWLVLDPLIALAVGLNILWEGGRLMRESVDGLMDRSLDEPSQARLRAELDAFAPRDVGWRNLRTRRAGTQAWVYVDVLVPGHWTVDAGHAMLDDIEAALHRAVPGAVVLTHLEPRDSRYYPGRQSNHHKRLDGE